MAMNNLAESSFAGVTVQLQVFGRIVVASADAIIDMARYGFFYRPTMNKEMSDNKKSLFHDFPEDLQITAIMCVVQEDPAKIQSSFDAMDTQRNTKQDKDKLMNWEGQEKATYEFIKCQIYRQMWDSDRRWKTAGGVKNQLEL